MLTTPVFFTSHACFQVGRVLLEAGQPVSLRQIAYRGGLGIRSVQLALNKLMRTRIVRKFKESNRVYFTIVDTTFDGLEEMLFIITINQKKQLQSKAQHFSERVLKVLDTTDNLNKVARYLRSLNPIG